MTPQQSKIIEWLEYKGDEGTTVYEATLHGLGTELRKRISELKRDGYPITTEWVTINGRSHKKYYLGQQ
jgi:hypothetical protein